MNNNPIRYIDPNGMYFDEANERKAGRIEQQAERRATKFENKANQLEAKGNSIGDLRERAGELRKSAQDIRDMSGDKTTEYRYANASNKNNPAGTGNPATIPTGINSKGHNVVTMYSDGVGSRIHESRHGGQIARGEQNFDINSEVSAYRAQYAYDGYLNYQPADYLKNNPTLTSAFRSLGSSVIPITTISNISLINRALIQNIGEEGNRYGIRTWVPIYQNLK